MKSGEKIFVPAKIVRVEGDVVTVQLDDGFGDAVVVCDKSNLRTA